MLKWAPLWRNWLARSAINRKVGGSIPLMGELISLHQYSFNQAGSCRKGKIENRVILPNKLFPLSLSTWDRMSIAERVGGCMPAHTLGYYPLGLNHLPIRPDHLPILPDRIHGSIWFLLQRFMRFPALVHLWILCAEQQHWFSPGNNRNGVDLIFVSFLSLTNVILLLSY